MNNKRLVITSTISLILVSILLIGSTYAIFTSSEVDENENVYTTGNLNITYTVSNDNNIITDTTPTSIEESTTLKPYRIKVTNNGNVAYNFNIILTDTTASNKINYNYIMTQVGILNPQPLSNTTNNILKSDVTILPNTSVDIDVRVWLSDTIKNTEAGKSFYAKLSIDGLAINTDKTEIDNSDLIAISEQSLSSVSVGSWVKYTGNNGCSGKSCEGQNANYVSDTNMGYCQSTSSKFTVNGWRVAYKSNNTAYLASAGAPECITGGSSSTVADGGYTEIISETQAWTNSNDTYKFCKAYSFNSSTGIFTLDTSNCQSITATLMSGYTIYQGYIYSCNSNTETTCSTMYEFSNSMMSANLNYKTHTAVSNGGTSSSSQNGIMHINSLNNIALKYCNKTYAYGGICNSNSAWNIGASDFQMITGKALSSSSCYSRQADTSCGYNNDLIDNGGYYWFANLYESNNSNLLLWAGSTRKVSNADQTYAYGARPILRLDSKVTITGGSGTYKDPYTIKA